MMRRRAGVRGGGLLGAALLGAAALGEAAGGGGGEGERGAAGPPLLGVNVHFAKGKEGEVAQLARGFAAVRNDFRWTAVDAGGNGTYDFSLYEAQQAELAAHGLTALFILDYSNGAVAGCGPKHTGVRTKECREAFAAWAVASMEHFKGSEPRPIFELWNEPNGFWDPFTNYTEYAELANTVFQQRALVPGLEDESTLIGPGVASFHTDDTWWWLEQCAKLGGLDGFDWVSVHPYRSDPPETALEDYRRLHVLVGDNRPLASSEWGYSTCDPFAEEPRVDCGPGTGHSEATAAKYLARMWLSNSLAGMPISIWYDWQDDCTDAADRECRHGAVENHYFNKTLPHKPKPAFEAAVTVQKTVGGRALLGPLEVVIDPAASAPVHQSESADGEGVFALEWDGGVLSAWNWVGANRTDSSCAMDLRDTTKCGIDLTKGECEALGCCFVDNVPNKEIGTWCHFPPQNYSVRAEIDTGTESALQCWSRVGLDGSEQGQECADEHGKLVLALDDSPTFLVP